MKAFAIRHGYFPGNLKERKIKKMENHPQKSKEALEAQHKMPTLLKIGPIPQMKVRSDIHSGQCELRCSPPPNCDLMQICS